MPQISVIANEISGSGTGIPTGTGAAFIAGVTDAGPPPNSTLYIACRSLNDFVTNFGPRSATSAAVYDWLDEFYADGGQLAYVTRVSDSTATTSALTLNDAGAFPTVTASALTPGAEGNLTQLTVTAGTNATFTANTTSSSTSISNISSTKNIAQGTPVTGTGIPANTYVVSVNSGAKTAVLSNSATATATGVTITPGTITVAVTVLDSSGNTVASETHGPYYQTSQLFADTSSGWVSFAQATGGGNTQNLPVALSATALTGGQDATDLTDSSHVAALANFPRSLGRGTVALPGKTSLTAWQGLDAHGLANNRFAVKDMTDSTLAGAVAGQAATLAVTSSTSYGMFVQGSLVLPGMPGSPTVTRTVAGSAAVAALRARVAATSNQNQAPCGTRFGLTRPIGFTTYHGPVPVAGAAAGSFTASDVQTMEAAGVNCFANFHGVLCLYGFVTPVPKLIDSTYWQASASCERMALIDDCETAAAKYLFDPITAETITALHGDLEAIGSAHEGAGALFDLDGLAAFSVETDSPINTPATAAAGQLNAELYARLTPYADAVNLTITVVPITSNVPQEVTA